jgi:metal-dependent HD superfamily phosphatase/phosphodiesterase
MSVVKLEDVRNHPKTQLYLERADKYLEAIGYTEHGIRHAETSAKRAKEVLLQLQIGEKEAEIAAIASFLHDIGNMMGRVNHGLSGAMLAKEILDELKMETRDVATIMGAIGNHEEEVGDPADITSAALILGDKSDVHRSRVRNPKMVSFDIHDRVNYAVTDSSLRADPAKRVIYLELVIDTHISQVMEYFEIFLSRMTMAKKSAKILNCDFKLLMNGIELL